MSNYATNMNKDFAERLGSPEAPNPLLSNATRKVKRRKVAEDERKRAVRACDGCRRVKEKCEGGIPCRRCSHFQRPCEFKGVKSAQSPYGEAVQNQPETNTYHMNELLIRSRYLEKIVRHKIPGQEIDTPSLRRLSEAIGEHFSNKSTISDPEGEGQPVLADDDDVEIRPVEGNITHYSGEFSYWNFSQRIKRHVEDWMGSANPEVSTTERVSEFWRAEPLLSSSHSLSSALACCPPRDIAEFLVHAFFRHAESNYFYVDKAWLLGVLDGLYNEPNKLVAKDAGKVGIALATFAIGTQYAYLESLNASGATGTATAGFSEDEVGTMFFEQGAKLLPEIIQIASLESVQACLLLGLYCLPLDASGLAYTYFNLAIKLAIQNGMHRQYAGSAFDDVTTETRNRVWWTVYVVEKKIGIFHGRPTSVLRSDVDADLPRDRPDMYPTGSASNIPYMLASIRLLHKLEDFFKEMQLVRKCQKSELPGILSRLIAMKDLEAKWFEALPPEIHSESVTPRSVNFRPSMHLKLEYCLLRMFVGRPFLFSRHAIGATPTSTSRKNSNPAASITTTANSEADKKTSRRAILIDDCVQAAKEAIAVCHRLREGVGLARASYIEYSSCRASLLVLIAYCIYNQTDQFRESLQTGLSMIREMSATGESARAEVSLIEALERALARLQFFGAATQRHVDISPGPTSTMSGYDRFRNWQAMLKGGSAVNAPASASQQSSMPAPASNPKINPGFRQHQFSHDWSIDSGSDSGAGLNFTLPNADTDSAAGLGPLHSAAESAFFGLDNMFMSSNEMVHHPERQVLHDFLAIPDFEFSMGFDHADSNGRNGPRGYTGESGFGTGTNGSINHW